MRIGMLLLQPLQALDHVSLIFSEISEQLQDAPLITRSVY